jgi:chemotaxis protein methyltransferase WspC
MSTDTPHAPLPGFGAPSFEGLCALLETRIGLDPRSLGEVALQQVFFEAQQRLGVDSQALLLRKVATQPEAFAQLVELVSVPESWFFRDEAQIEYFVQFALRSREKLALSKLNILSLPCARGEEPFSLAIALFEVGFKPEEFAILAIDLNEKFVERAKLGVFPKWSLRGKPIPPAYLEWDPEGLKVSANVRAQVRFRVGNVLDPQMLLSEPGFDVVFCRNLLIYLTENAKTRCLHNLKQRLLPGALVVSGHAENIAVLDKQFVPLRIAANNCFEIATAAGRIQSCPPDLDSIRLHPQSSPRTAPLTQLAFAPLAKNTHSDVAPKITPVAPLTPPPIDSKSSLQATAPKVLQDVQALADRGEIAQARAQLDQLLAQFARAHAPAQAIYLDAVLCMANGDKAAAVAALKQALYLDREHLDALTLLASLLEGEDDQVGALRLRERLNRALKLARVGATGFEVGNGN